MAFQLIFTSKDNATRAVCQGFKIILYIFLHKSDERAVPDVQSRMRAQFPATETADAAVIVNVKRTVLDFNCSGRASIPAYSAQAAFFRNGKGT